MLEMERKGWGQAKEILQRGQTVSSARSAIVNKRVIRTAAKPVVRATVLMVSTSGMRANHWRAVLLRGRFSARVVGPDEVIEETDAGKAPNVIVLDMADPTFDGLAVCRALRELDVQSAILMLHPEGSLDDLLDGYEAGTDAYLTGPVDHAELFDPATRAYINDGGASGGQYVVNPILARLGTATFLLGFLFNFPHFALFTIFINIHHYVIDGVIWRKENGDVGRYLLQA